MDFTGFLGNDAVKARLSGAFASGRVAHSYLICGPVGSGKHTLAHLLAATILCEGTEPPCMTCHACRRVLEDIHPDVIWVEDKDKKTVTVDLMRQARADAESAYTLWRLHPDDVLPDANPAAVCPAPAPGSQSGSKGRNLCFHARSRDTSCTTRRTARP